MAAGALLLAHLSPLIAWHVGLARPLREAPSAHRLRSAVVDRFPDVPPDWEPWRVGPLAFDLPPDGRRSRGCEGDAAGCFIELPVGSLSVMPAGHQESYEEMLDFRAPDERDLSVWRSARANWATIRALQIFVQTSRSQLESRRFHSAGAKGVFVRTVREGKTRWVVAAYAPDESASRGLAVAGIAPDAFRALLGSLDLRPPGKAADPALR